MFIMGLHIWYPLPYLFRFLHRVGFREGHESSLPFLCRIFWFARFYGSWRP